MKKIKLGDIPVFQFIDRSMAKTLSDCSQLIEKLPGQAILMEGEPTPGLFILVEGEANIFLGKEKNPILTLSQGEVFGEMALIDQSRASATIRAGDNGAQLVFLHKESFTKKIEESSELERCFFKGASAVLTQRLRHANSAALDLIVHQSSFSSLQEQLAAMIKKIKDSKSSALKIGDHLEDEHYDLPILLSNLDSLEIQPTNLLGSLLDTHSASKTA